MKLSKRETFMVVGLVFVVFIAGFWFLLLSPARASLKAAQLEYTSIKLQDDTNQQIIDSVIPLKSTRDALKVSLSDIEKRLLPELRNEVITEHLASIFKDNGLPFIMFISCEPAVTENLVNADGNYSINSVQWVRVNMKVSGTDGVTEGGIPAVGYSEFIAAVKQIETANPDSIHVSSIAMEDTLQGFQYFTIAVDIYAFTLPNRISAIDPSEPYLIWNRDPAVSGGLFGIPAAGIAPSQFYPLFYRPFATVQTTTASPNNTANPSNTAVPTPTP